MHHSRSGDELNCNRSRFVTILLYTLAAAEVSIISIYTPWNVDGYRRARVMDMIQGNAWKPYVHRALVPGLVRTIVNGLPDSWEVALRRDLEESPLVQDYFESLQRNPAHALEFLLVDILMYLSLVGFALSLDGLFSLNFQALPWFRSAVVLAGLFALPPFFSPLYLYDFTALFLTTLALVMMRRRNWSGYLAVYALSCINKETTLVLTIAFAAYWGPRLGWRSTQFVRLVCVQLAMLTAVKLMLTVLFWPNPGGILEWHLSERAQWWTSTYDFTGLLVCLVYLLLVFSRWPEKPLFLRRTSVMFFPLFAAFIPFGWKAEFRNMFEVYPVVVLLAAHSVALLAGVPLRVMEESEGEPFKSYEEAAHPALENASSAR